MDNKFSFYYNNFSFYFVLLYICLDIFYKFAMAWAYKIWFPKNPPLTPPSDGWNWVVSLTNARGGLED